jgi:hypothetical protein
MQTKFEFKVAACRGETRFRARALFFSEYSRRFRYFLFLKAVFILHIAPQHSRQYCGPMWSMNIALVQGGERGDCE